MNDVVFSKCWWPLDVEFTCLLQYNLYIFRCGLVINLRNQLSLDEFSLIMMTSAHITEVLFVSVFLRLIFSTRK